MKKLTKFVLMDHTDGMTLKNVVDHRSMKDRIFDHIYEKFAKGEKLQAYHNYTSDSNIKDFKYNEARKTDNSKKNVNSTK